MLAMHVLRTQQQIGERQGEKFEGRVDGAGVDGRSNERGVGGGRGHAYGRWRERASWPTIARKQATTLSHAVKSRKVEI
jgi:hypothetical protein